MVNAKNKVEEKQERPLWFKRSKEEVEALVTKLAKQGVNAEKIGLILRDTYGVPSTKLVAEKISSIISKSLAYIPSDLANLEKRAAQLKKHLEKNKQDRVAKRGLQITLARINKLKKYYSRKKVLK